MPKAIEIDGSQGEGGGQVLRTSLALSMITGRRLVMERIRAGRPKPGLKRQHVACVKAAARLSSARVAGAELGSQSLRFDPGKVTGGTHEFRIGSAGSVTLVAQTVLPALLHAGLAAHIEVEGGTHVPLAPVFEHLDLAFAHTLRKLGVAVDVTLTKHGFAPDGGGRITLDLREPASTTPSSAPPTPPPTPPTLTPHELIDRGALKSARLVAIRASDADIAAVRDGLGALAAGALDVVTVDPKVRGSAMALVVEHDNAVDVFSGLGKDAARDLLQEARVYFASGAAVGAHLADQLLLPLALTGGGAFSTSTPTLHTRTNADVIRRFLDVDIAIAEDGARHVIRVGAAR